MAESDWQRPDLFKLLEIAEARRRYHHNALWEEEKHFTWWVALILTALVALVTSPSIAPCTKSQLLLAGSFLGFVLSRIAWAVIRYEGVAFAETMQICNRASYLLGLFSEARAVNEPAVSVSELAPRYYPITCFEKVKNTANKSRWAVARGIFQMSGHGVRDSFQLVFVISALVFMVVYALTFPYFLTLVWRGKITGCFMLP